MLDPNAPCLDGNLDLLDLLDHRRILPLVTTHVTHVTTQELAGEFEGSLRPAGRVVRGAKDHPEGHGTHGMAHMAHMAPAMAC